MRQVKIRIVSFPVFQLVFENLLLRRGGLSFNGSQKGNKGADTDLMFQFCLPNAHRSV